MDQTDRQLIIQMVTALQGLIKSNEMEIKTLKTQLQLAEIRIESLGSAVFGTISPPSNTEDPESGMDDEPEVCWPMNSWANWPMDKEHTHD